MSRKFHAVLILHSEGVSVSCPELPGCFSQGATTEEAMENIRDAIAEYLEVFSEPADRREVREVEMETAVR